MARSRGQRISEQERRDELLSAYLDGELSVGERARLEAQLAADPVLRAELDALRHTVALVRDLPAVSIPRNFILARDVAARPRPARQARPRLAWAAPFLTAVTAVASLLFVVVLAGDLLLSGAGDMASAPVAEPQMAAEAPREPPAAMPASEEEVVVEAEVEVTVEVEVEAEGEVTLGTVPTGTPLPMPAEAPPEAASPVTVEAEEYAAEMAPEVAADVDATAVAMGGGGTIEPAVSTPIPSPPVAEEVEKALTTLPTATAAARAAVGVAEPAPGEVGEAEAPLEAAQDEEAEAAEPPPAAAESEPERILPQRAVIPPWRALEVALGLIAFGLALATIWAWRARRR